MDGLVLFDKDTSRERDSINNIYKPDLSFLKEIQELDTCKKNFSKLNFKRLETFFRTFCVNKKAEGDYLLRANRESFRKGIQYWYNGRDNPAVAQLLYSYLGKQKVNHLIKFSEFIYFIQELKLSEAHQNLLVFKMLSENRTELKIQILLKQFVSTEQGSKLASEISIILDSYLSKTLNTIKHPGGSIDPYDVRYFNSLIPHSILAKELIYKFVDTPEQAFDEFGTANPSWD